MNIADSYQQQQVMDLFNSMARNHTTSDPRLQELMNIVSNLFFNKNVSQLSQGWQTGMDFLGRAIVGSPLGSMMGMVDNGNSFATMHQAIMRQGALGISNPAGEYGLSYGMGTNTLSLANQLMSSAGNMNVHGVSPDMAAQFMAMRIAREGFGRGDVVQYNAGNTAESIWKTHAQMKAQGTVSQDTMDATARAAIIMEKVTPAVQSIAASQLAPEVADTLTDRWNAMSKADRELYGNSQNNYMLQMGADEATRKKMLRDAEESLRSGDPLALKALTDAAQSEATKRGISGTIDAAEVERVMTAQESGMNITTYTNTFAERQKEALKKHSSNLKDLVEIFDTKNLSELEQLTNSLQMGSFTNERTVTRMRERIDDAKQIARSTNRDVKEVFAEQSSVIDMLSLGMGGRQYVNSGMVSQAQRDLISYRRNAEMGFDTRTEAQYMAEKAAEVANSSQQFGGLAAAQYALEKHGDILTDAQKQQLQALVTGAGSMSREDAINASSEATTLLNSINKTIFGSDAFRREAVAKSSFNVSAFSKRNLTSTQAAIDASNYFHSSPEAASALGSRKTLTSYLGNLYSVFGEDVAGGRELFEAIASGKSEEEILATYRNTGASEATLKSISTLIQDYTSLTTTDGGVDKRKQAELQELSRILQTESRTGSGAMSIDRARKEKSDMWWSNLTDEFGSVDTKENGFVAGLLGLTGELTDAGVLIAGNSAGLGSQDYKTAIGKMVTRENGDQALELSYQARDAELLKAMGVESVEAFNALSREDQYEALRNAENANYAVAYNKTYGLLVQKKDKEFEEKRNRIAKETKHMAPIAQLLKGQKVSKLKLDNGSLSFTLDNLAYSGTEAVDKLLSMSKEDTPEAKAFRAAMDESSDPEMKKLNAMMKLRDYTDDSADLRYMDGDEIDKDSEAYLLHKHAIDLYYKKNPKAEKGISIDQIYQNLLSNSKTSGAAQNFLKTGVMDTLNSISGLTKDELMAEGYIDEDGEKWTSKAGNLSGKNASSEFLKAISQMDRRQSEVKGESLLEQLFTFFKSLTQGNALKVVGIES